MTALERIHGGWRYEGVDYPLPLPVNSAVSFAVARTNTEAVLREKVKRGGFNNSIRRKPRLKYPEFAHLNEEQRKRAIAGMHYHTKGVTHHGVFKGGKRPDLPPLELLEMYGLPMPPGDVNSWRE